MTFLNSTSQSGHGSPHNKVGSSSFHLASLLIPVSHLYRAFFEISLDTFEITGPQMVLTMKLSTFAWNVYDGRQPTEVRVLRCISLMMQVQH